MVRSRHRDHFDITDEPLPWDTAGSPTALADRDPRSAEPSMPEDRLDTDQDHTDWAEPDRDAADWTEPDWDESTGPDWDESAEPDWDEFAEPDWSATAPVTRRRRASAWPLRGVACVAALLMVAVGMRVVAAEHPQAPTSVARTTATPAGQAVITMTPSSATASPDATSRRHHAARRHATRRRTTKHPQRSSRQTTNRPTVVAAASTSAPVAAKAVATAAPTASTAPATSGSAGRAGTQEFGFER
jgi:hypothetical protein